MATQDAMLRALHQADKSTLNKRYTPQQLEAAFKALGKGKGRAPAAPAGPMTPSQLPNVSIPEQTETLGNTASANLETSGLGQSFNPAEAASNLAGTELGTAFNPELTARESSGSLLADRQRIEDELFKSLTRRSDEQYGRDEEAMRQRLANEGIAYSNDPNSAYQQRIGDLNNRYDDQRLEAGRQASIYGGQELERQFGMGEQLRANEFSEQAGTRNQSMNEVLGLQGYSTGNRNQSLNEVSTLTGLQALLKELSMKGKLLPAQISALNRSNRPGGGAAPAEEESPFVNSAPPGL